MHIHDKHTMMSVDISDKATEILFNLIALEIGYKNTPKNRRVHVIKTLGVIFRMGPRYHTSKRR